MKEYFVVSKTVFIIDAENEYDAFMKYKEAIKIENGGDGEWPDWYVYSDEVYIEKGEEVNGAS